MTDTTEKMEQIGDSLKSQGYEGLDVNLNISLFEYRLVVKKLENDQYKIIYKYTDNRYCCQTVRVDLINEIIESSWCKLESILSFTGMDKNDWLNQTFMMQLSDLLQYYGALNIFGDLYNYYTFDELYKSEVLEH